MKLTLTKSLTAMGLLISTIHADTAMMTGKNGFSTTPIYTVGEEINGYFAPGILDGMFAYDAGDHVHLLVNHEIAEDLGPEYTLDNGTVLIGARVSAFKIDKATRTVTDAGLAYGTIYNRAGEIVDEPSDLTFGALNRFCSANGVHAGTYGFVDDIFITGEERGGGTQFALDVANGDLWAAPALGVGAWESAAPLAVPSINKTHVALLMGDDRAGAPLYLYVGEKDNSKGAGFLARNGLAQGNLYMWKANDGSTIPSDFTGNGNFRTGSFVEVENFNAEMAGQDGFDDLGYADQDNLDAQHVALGTFQFSRPEDVATNPYNGTQAVFASTGGVLDPLNANGDAFDAADIWGTTYLVDVKISKGSLSKGKIGGNLRIIADGDSGLDPAPPRISFAENNGLRSPDNLCWALDHKIYVQEDRASGFHLPDDNGLGDLFLPGEESSIWQVHPHSGAKVRVAQMNRAAELPAGQQEGFFGPFSLSVVVGIWESSGIIDVSTLFGAEKGSLFLLDVQAHSTFGGAIDSENLVEGGQILFLEKE